MMSTATQERSGELDRKNQTTEVDAAEVMSLLDKHVVVRYDGNLYPGIVIDEDHEDVQVKCMHKIGRNRFFWPSYDDICWYSKDDLVCELPEPEKVTQRHHQVDPAIWHKIDQ
jgi:hypothetical protein